MRSIILLLFFLLTCNLWAQGQKKYEFPPLETEQNTDKSDYQSIYPPMEQGNKSSYFQQPKYTFPELEESQQDSNNSSARHYSQKRQQAKSEQDYLKLPSTKSKSADNLRDYNRNDYKQEQYKSDYYNTDSYTGSYPYRRMAPYYQQRQYYAYDPYSMNSYYNNMNNVFSSPGYNPFTDGFMGNNSSWNPFYNSFSGWPNFNNGMFGSPSQSYPNIRTPGFFSR